MCSILSAVVAARWSLVVVAMFRKINSNRSANRKRKYKDKDSLAAAGLLVEGRYCRYPNCRLREIIRTLSGRLRLGRLEDCVKDGKPKFVKRTRNCLKFVNTILYGDY